MSIRNKNLMAMCCFVAVLTVACAALGVEPSTESDSKTVVNPGAVRLLLPRIIPATVGLECNIYFDNVVLVPDASQLLFNVTSRHGMQFEERWTWQPEQGDVGDHSLELEVRDAANQVIASSHTTVRVSSIESFEKPTQTVLCIGDSLTHASFYTGRLLELSKQQGGSQIELVGTNWIYDQVTNRHEGYSGWTAKYFTDHFTGVARTGKYEDRGSPFLYQDEGGPRKLDFSRYCEETNHGEFPDVVTIFLGPNDVFWFSDESIEEGIDDVLTHFEQLIQMIRRSSPATKIGIMLPVPPAESQDAFGKNYGCRQTRWQYRRNQHRFVERLLESYETKAGIGNIHIIPTNVCLDSRNSYPTSSQPLNSNNRQVTVSQRDGVHPAESGYHQIADMLFSWLKNHD